MSINLRIGIIGDFDRNRSSHAATNTALDHAAHGINLKVDSQWVPTPELEHDSNMRKLATFDAFWCSPGGPYKSIDGAIRAIKFSRENGKPFFGT